MLPIEMENQAAGATQALLLVRGFVRILIAKFFTRCLSTK